jgi:hypothetical protein
MGMIIKMITKHSLFALNPEVSETDFLLASDKMQEEFYSQHDSLKRRELLKTKENTWIEILHWSGNGPAKHIQEAYWASDSCMAFMGMIQKDSFNALTQEEFKALNVEQLRVHNGTD